MVKMESNFMLTKLNTFGMQVQSAAYSRISSKEQIPEMIQQPAFKMGIFILGGGSNLLLTKDIDKWVWHNQIKGIHPVKEDQDFVWLEAGAGEVWNDFVQYTVCEGLGGVENLSLIPGTVGAAPVQNIGAYGVEAKETIDSVKAWHLTENKACVFSNSDCRLAYRNSIFKQELKEQLVITSVVFKLRKVPVLNMAYGTIRKELEQMEIQQPTVKSVSEAVSKIRKSKLPDPAVIGNAGSFFKNPVIEVATFERLRESFPGIPEYRISTTETKVPAAWLIEQCGWKGRRIGDAGVHPNQPLVLVNYGNATGQEIFNLSEKIISSVSDKFAIQLEREVRVF